MRSMKNPQRMIIGLGILLASLVVFLPLPQLTKPTTHSITVDSHQFAYTPSRFKVNQGDRVIIMFTASDVVHGFYLDGYNISERVEPGITKQIEFVANQSGKFRYRCSVSCGPLHPFMIGEMVVGPNTMFWRAIALVLISVSTTLSILWISKRDSPHVTYHPIA